MRSLLDQAKENGLRIVGDHRYALGVCKGNTVSRFMSYKGDLVTLRRRFEEGRVSDKESQRLMRWWVREQGEGSGAALRGLTSGTGCFGRAGGTRVMPHFPPEAGSEVQPNMVPSSQL